MSHPSQARAPGGPPLGLVLLLVAFVALRFFRLGEWGLWIDEAFTLNDLRAAAAGREPWPGNSLGYRLVAEWLDLVGVQTELALRVVPAVFGAALLPLAYWAFRPFAGARNALIAAVLLGANTWTLYWAQNARFYSIAQTLGVVGIGFLARALFQSGTWRAYAWLALALASFGAATLAHPSALLFGGAACAAPVVLWLARVRPGGAFGRVTLTLVGVAVACLALAVPWAQELWTRYQESKSGPSPLHFVLTTGYHVTPWLAAAAAGGALVAFRTRDPFRAWVAAALVATIVAALLLSLQARVSAQYVFVALPAVALLAAYGLEALAERKAALARAALVVMLCASAADQAHYFFARNGDRERWREAYQFVWNSRGASDLIVGMAGPVGEYYLAPDS
ncbi:MAG: hypothetical protein IT453_19255, partial [Planctomycetes bacterium]|nr:hypothetical protein [Planctomycetota bacterium]